MMKKCIYIIAVVVVIFSVVTICFPINMTMMSEAKKICDEHELLSKEDEGEYVTRMEFSEALCALLGSDISAREVYLNALPGTFPTDPTKDFDYIKTELFSETQSEEKLIDNATDVFYNIVYPIIIQLSYSQILQVHEYESEDSIKHSPCTAYSFDIGQDITIKEAAVMIQSCLQDFETDLAEGKYSTKSKIFSQLYSNARKTKIISMTDGIYWIQFDRKLKRKEAYVLLNRMMQKDRYRYNTPTGDLCFDDEGSILYLENLINR